MADAPPTLRVLKLFTDAPFTHTGGHLRGSLNRAFPDRPRLHNHPPDGRPRPSVVRFVVHDHVACVVAAGPGREDALELYEQVREITAPNRTYRIIGRELIEAPLDLGPIDGLITHRFITPWLALNQENHRRFEGMSHDAERCDLLERIFRGNVLTAADAVGLRLPERPRVLARVESYRARPIRVGAQRLLGFDAVVTTNLRWTHWLGVGKQASKGFGRFVPM